MFPSIALFAAELRDRGYTFEMAYGSGGYFVVLYDLSYERSYSDFSWDIDSLVKKLVERAETDRQSFRDEDTNPGVRNEQEKDTDK